MKLKKLAFLALIFLFSAQSNGSFAHRVDASGCSHLKKKDVFHACTHGQARKKE